MGGLRRSLGIFVMVAGVIGLILSIAGLVGIVIAKPILTDRMNTTVDILSDSVDTSVDTLDITGDALSATINSINTLSVMLDATALTVEDTQPIFDKLNVIMAEKLPETIATATDSLTAAESAADSLESAIKSFEVLQTILGSSYFLSAIMPPAGEPYNPEKTLADSLSELSKSMEGMPDTFIDMSSDLEKADDNLVQVKDSMVLMSDNVLQISDSLTQYKNMISQSKTSTENLRTMLSGLQKNLGNIMNAAFIVIILFFLWLLAFQVVIFSQGWELYRGTANGMATDESEPTSNKPSVVEIDTSEQES